MEFWECIDKIISEHKIIIDRPKGAPHPKFSYNIYPADYGYLKGTNSGDGEGIDVYVGSLEGKRCDAYIIIVDLLKNEIEIKLLIGCTEEEKKEIFAFQNTSDMMKGMLVKR